MIHLLLGGQHRAIPRLVAAHARAHLEPDEIRQFATPIARVVVVVVVVSVGEGVPRVHALASARLTRLVLIERVDGGGDAPHGETEGEKPQILCGAENLNLASPRYAGAAASGAKSSAAKHTHRYILSARRTAPTNLRGDSFVPTEVSLKVPSARIVLLAVGPRHGFGLRLSISVMFTANLGGAPRATDHCTLVLNSGESALRAQNIPRSRPMASRFASTPAPRAFGLFLSVAHATR